MKKAIRLKASVTSAIDTPGNYRAEVWRTIATAEGNPFVYLFEST